MTDAAVSFKLIGASWALAFSPGVIRTFAKSAQPALGSKETVGQLYARDLTGPLVEIDRATILEPIQASRSKVAFDTAVAMAERRKLFDLGLHCVGLWHTHPEPTPVPSFEDISLARNHAQAASHQVSGIVFAIIGNAPLPSGLGVWIDDGACFRKAERRI